MCTALTGYRISIYSLEDILGSFENTDISVWILLNIK